MSTKPDRPTPTVWARFRFSVVGSLLSSPPARRTQGGHPRPCRQDLVASGNRTRCSFHGCHHRAVVLHCTAPTRRPRGGPATRLRKDCGKVTLSAAVAERLMLQYHDYPHWSYQLHYDNLAASVKANPALGPLRSYSTVKRYMQAHGLVRN